MLECVHTLIKIAQNKDVFMCDFVEFVKLAQQKLYQFLYDPYAKYENLAFDEFNSIQVLTNIPFLWASFLIWKVERMLYTLCFHLLTINTLITNAMLKVVEKKNLSPKMFLTMP